MPVPKFTPITIPTFDGDITQWTPFWDIFDCMVHDRTDLSDVVKFTTLRAHLTGQAFKSIEGVAVTNANYQGVVTRLKKQFGNRDRLISGLIRELQNLPAPRHTHTELLNFKLSFEKLVSQIQQLDPLDTSNRLFRETLISKIPATSFDILAQKYKTTQFTYEHITEGLEGIINLMELCALQPHSPNRKET